MNWGKALALALGAFALMMAWFVVMALRNPTPLVTEDYYEKELVYQDRIDGSERANALSEKVSFALVEDGVRLVFPEELHDLVIEGELTLLRPNDPRADRVLPVRAIGGVFEVTQLDLWPGRYKASLEWTADGLDYFTSEEMLVP